MSEKFPGLELIAGTIFIDTCCHLSKRNGWSTGTAPKRKVVPRAGNYFGSGGAGTQNRTLPADYLRITHPRAGGVQETFREAALDRGSYVRGYGSHSWRRRASEDSKGQQEEAWNALVYEGVNCTCLRLRSL